VEGLKSCLKSESRSSSASRSSSGLLRSESPATGRESPAKQGTVNFRPQPNVKTFEKEQEEEEERVVKSVDTSTDLPTFDWVEFSSSEGQTKGKIQTNGGTTKEVKEESKKKVERIVPIILNGREEGRSRSREKAPNPFLSGSKGSEGLKSKEEKERFSNGTSSSSPTKIAPLATAEMDKTEAACYACDMSTQTEVPSKKGCHVM